MSKKTVLLCLSICAILLALTGCAVETTEHFFTGTVFNSDSGAPVQGYTVGFGAVSATTGADGRFSISLGKGGGSVSGAFYWYKTGYRPFFMNLMTASSSHDIDVILYASTIADSGTYPTKAFTGEIFYNGGAELENGKTFSITILSESGAYLDELFNSTYNNEFSMDTFVLADNAIIVVEVEDSSSNITHMAIVYNQDMSVAEPSATITLRDPAAEPMITGVNVNAAALGNYGMINY
ncbi:MAG: hypothetical protein EHM28_05890, partial [Spirochaetaceae bacterium]